MGPKKNDTELPKATYVIDVAIPKHDHIRPTILGICDDGRTIAIHVDGFRSELLLEPLYSSIDSRDDAELWYDGLTREIQELNDDIVMNVVQRQKLFGCGNFYMVQLLFQSQSLLRKIRDLVRNIHARVYHDKIEPELQFMSARGIRPFIWINTPSSRNSSRARTSNCDIEIMTTIRDITNDSSSAPSTPPLFRLGSFDIETDNLDPNTAEIRMIAFTVFELPSREYTSHMLCRHEMKFESDRQYSVDIYSVDIIPSERDLIRRFIDLVGNSRCIVLTGWNICNFDLAFIWTRAGKLGIQSHLNRLSWLPNVPLRPYRKRLASSAYGQNEIFVMNTHGMVIVDGYVMCRKGPKRPSYSLRAVAETFQLRKGDVTYEEMVEAFTSLDPTKMGIVADYCVQDAEVAGLILLAMEEPLKLHSMSTLSGAPCSWLINYGAQRTTWSLFYTESRKYGSLCFNARRSGDKEDGDEEQHYQGATVVEPRKGYYQDPIITCDFASLYPSIMRSCNLCPTTLRGVFHPTHEELSKYMSNPDEYLCVKLDSDRIVVFSLSKHGIIPSILATLTQRRSEQKRFMEAAKDPVEKARYNANQNSLKISSNSIYGCLGSKTGPFGVDGVVIAEIVTFLGRTYLNTVMQHIPKLVERNILPSGSTVIYGDTDSVMIRIPGIDAVRDGESVGNIIAKECTQILPDPMKSGAVRLEYEVCHVRFLLKGKKMYAAYGIDGKMKTKGLATVRRDFPQVAQDSISAILQQLLEYGGDGALENALERVLSIMGEVRENSVPYERLQTTKELNKSTYKSLPPHQVVSQKLSKRDPLRAPKPGDRISFVILKGPQKNVSERAEDVNYAREHRLPVDAFYYNDMIRTQTLPLFELAGYGVEAKQRMSRVVTDTILSVQRQRTITSMIEKLGTVSSSRGVVKEREQKRLKQSSIRDFFKR